MPDWQKFPKSKAVARGTNPAHVAQWIAGDYTHLAVDSQGRPLADSEGRLCSNDPLPVGIFMPKGHAFVPGVMHYPSLAIALQRFNDLRTAV